MSRLRWAFAFAAATVTLAVGSQARGEHDVRVDANTRFRFYEVRSPITPVVWTRRRLVQTLGVSYAHPLSDDHEPLRLVANLRLRLDQDFSRTCFVDREGCVQARNPDDEGEYLPLARNTRVDAPGAWVQLQELPGHLRVRVGRHLRRSVIGLLRIDGATVRSEPHPYVAVEAFGGRVVRETSFAGSDGFAPQGALRLRLPEGVDRERVPYVAPPSTTWAWGAWLEAGAVELARAHVGYREIIDESGLVARNVAAGVVSQPIDALRLQAEGVWDAVDGSLVDALGSARVHFGDWTVSARAERHVPRFDYGTIWAWFDLVPVDQLRLGADWRPSSQWSLGGGLRGRRADRGEQGSELDAGIEGRARLHVGPWRARLTGWLESGDLGPAAAVLLRVRRPVATWLWIRARASVWHFDDELRRGMHGTSTTEAVAARFIITSQTEVRALIEHSHSRVAGHRFRGLGVLTVEVWR